MGEGCLGLKLVEELGPWESCRRLPEREKNGGSGEEVVMASGINGGGGWVLDRGGCWVMGGGRVCAWRRRGAPVVVVARQRREGRR